MDCSTARLFFQFNQAGCCELDGPEAEALDAHLTQCGACQQLALDAERLDRHLGQAMRDVPVPPGLKEQILLRLDADRGARHRRWGGRAILGAAAASLLLLAGWGVYAFFAPTQKTLLAEDVLQGGNLTRPATADAANVQLRKLGTVAGAPRFVNWGYQAGMPSLAILPGTEDDPVKVPQFIFTSNRGQAWIYAVPRKLYKVEALENPAHGYKFKVDLREEDPHFVHLILHTGESWENWLEDRTTE